MSGIVTIMMRFLFVIIMLLYTSIMYRLSAGKEKEKVTFFHVMAMICIVIFSLLGFGVLYANIREKYILGAGAVYVATIVVFYLIYVKVYKTNALTIVTNVLMLTTISIIMLLRLSKTLALRQITFVVGGLILLLALPYIVRKVLQIKNIHRYCAIVSVILLATVLVIGNISYGAVLSVDLGVISIQPYELVKVLYVIYIAGALKKKADFRTVFGVGIVTLINVLMLVLANDFGAVLIELVVFLLVVFVASANPAYIFAGAGCVAVFGTLAIKYVSHITTRFQAWIDPFTLIEDKGYQICQSLFAITAGGFFGKGLCNGMPGRIPVVEKDFIFSAIAEEFGVIIAIGVLLICFNIFLTLMNMAIKQKTKSNFVKLMMLGFGITYIFQVLLTIGGAIKFIPSTGVTLPFVSYGGSSLLGSMIMLSIIVSFGIRKGGAHETKKQ